jgi:hypothetical protein
MPATIAETENPMLVFGGSAVSVCGLQYPFVCWVHGAFVIAGVELPLAKMA